MRRAVVLVSVLLLAACTEASSSKLGDRTFRIEGPEVETISNAPLQRQANQLCPNGYRLLNSESHKGGVDRVTSDFETITVWTIRCV